MGPRIRIDAIVSGRCVAPATPGLAPLAHTPLCSGAPDSFRSSTQRPRHGSTSRGPRSARTPVRAAWSSPDARRPARGYQKIRHLVIRPYRPQTSGKIGRVHQTTAREGDTASCTRATPTASGRCHTRSTTPTSGGRTAPSGSGSDQSRSEPVKARRLARRRSARGDAAALPSATPEAGALGPNPTAKLDAAIVSPLDD